MDRDLDGKHGTRPGRQETSARGYVKISANNNSRNLSRTQQPGRYLCVDTREEQINAPRVHPNSCYTHNFSSASTRLKHFKQDVHQNSPAKKHLKTVQTRTVQPDSHCKFKTTLAIDYVRDIIDENSTNSRPISRRNSLKKNGPLKPLLGDPGHLALQPNVTKCLGIRNDRRKKTVPLGDGLEVREEVTSPACTRFSSASKRASPNMLTIDLRKLSLADQSNTTTCGSSIAFSEEPQANSGFSADSNQTPKTQSMINHKNMKYSVGGDGQNLIWALEEDNSQNTGIRYRPDFDDHIIDDIDDQRIDDIDYTNNWHDHEKGRQLDDNRIDHIDDIRDDSSVEHQVKLDYPDSINEEINSNDDIDDDLARDGSLVNKQSHQGEKSQKGKKLKRKLLYVNTSLLNSNNSSMCGESSPKNEDVKSSEPRKVEEFVCGNSPRDKKYYDQTTSKQNSLQLGTGSVISNVSHRDITDKDVQDVSSSFRTSDLDVNTAKSRRSNLDSDLSQLDANNRTSDSNPDIYEESHPKNVPHFSDSSNSTLPSLLARTPDWADRVGSYPERGGQSTSVPPLFGASESTLPSLHARTLDVKPTNEKQEICQESVLVHPSSPHQNTSVGPSFDSRISKTLSLNPRTHDLKHKPTDENLELHTRDLDKAQQNPTATPLSSASNSSLPSLNPSTPDQDSIHVKDIWKALVDGGYEISRDEVSKYKVNSVKPRVRSAPARRRSTQKNAFAKDLPTRAKSAVSRDDGKLSRKGCDMDETGDPRESKAPQVGGFFKEQASGNEEKSNQDSLDNDLEVVAVSKPVTQLRKRNIPLVPPINFQINTIPKSGHFFYFAYGLNMNQKRLRIQLRCKTGVRYWGLLFGFKLLFNKKGTADGGTGFPNVVHEPGFSVEGCVYELSLDRLPLLDTCVGFPKHYARLVLPVWLCNSSNPDLHGVAQHCVPAVVYVAQDDWLSSDANALDTSFTLKQCLLGTDLLTSNYQQFLNSYSQKTDTGENPM